MVNTFVIGWLIIFACIATVAYHLNRAWGRLFKNEADLVDYKIDQIDRLAKLRIQIDELGKKLLKLDVKIDQIDSELDDEARNINALADRLSQLETRPTIKPEDWQVLIGGKPYEIKALTATQFVIHLERLPEFIFGFIVSDKEPRPSERDAKLDEATQYAKELLKVSLVDKTAPLERLTLPEAQEAIRIIAACNGLDQQLAAIFKKKVAISSRSTSQPAVIASDLPN